MPNGEEEPKWLPMVVLPNVTFGAAVDAEIAAIVSIEDRRVAHLREEHPNLDSFLLRFTDAFGVHQPPSLLILREDASPTYRNIEAIAALRDAASISLIPLNRARELNTPRGHRIGFSNALSLYPWMIDKNYEHLIMNTFGHLGVHEVDQFCGQVSPEIFHLTLNEHDIDEPLLRVLLERWVRRYATSRPPWPDLVLFRSLNMANQACQLPAVMETILYDVGRLLGLWVSAFEILAHPQLRNSGLSVVYELLDRLNFQVRKCGHRRYLAYQGRGVRVRRPLPHWLYGEIYSARNDFLHGNPVTESRLRPSGMTGTLFQYAAPLYRLALTAFLELRCARELPTMEDAEVFAGALVEHYQFYRYQSAVEEALLLSRGGVQR